MQVLHLLWTGEIGGKERAVFQLVRSLQANGRVRPAIAFGQAHGHYVDQFLTLGCPVLDLGMKNGHDFLAAFRARKEMRRFPIHHFHSAEIPLMLSSLSCAGTVRCYTHRAGIHQKTFGKRVAYRFIGAMLRAGFRGLSANTRHGTFSAEQSTGVPSDRWKVTYNGMDFDLLRPKRSPEALAMEFGIERGRKVIIGASAHLRAWKRIELLLEACSKLDASAYQLLVVGDGPDRRRLEKIAHELGIQSQTKFVGMQEHIGDWLALMDVFMLPSGPGESFGNSAIEALGVGLPTIVFQDGGGLVEHITDGTTGYIVSSLPDLVERLKLLVEQPELRRSLGVNALKLTREKYSIANMTRAYDALYADICSSAQLGAGNK